MHLCNASGGGSRRSYHGQTFRGRSAEALARLDVQRQGTVQNWPSLDKHVWHLVATMLRAMGYGL